MNNNNLEKDLIRVTLQIVFLCFLGGLCSVCFGQLGSKRNIPRDPLGNKQKLGFSPTTTAFNTGQVGKQIEQRADFKKYGSSNRLVENMLVAVQGPIQRRPGTRYVATIPATAQVEPDPNTDCIQIRTPQQLFDVRNDLTACYELMNDIDMEGFDWRPIGDPFNGEDTFTGTFNGNFFIIDNLSYTSTNNYMGLFGWALNATIENTIVTNVDFHGDVHIGGVVGNAQNCNMLLCGSTGNIYTDQAAPIAQFIGGLIGEHSIGVGSRNLIQRCWSTVTLNVNYINNISDGSVGGLIGKAGTSNIQNCWASGSIIINLPGSRKPYAALSGGLIGDASSVGEGFPKFCHAYGAIPTSGSQASDVTNRIGGFIGRWQFAAGVPDEMTDCHWDTDTSGLTWGAEGYGPPANSALPGLTGHVTSVSQQQATYTNWDFDDIWQIDEGSGYPTLQWVDRDINPEGKTVDNEVVRLLPFEAPTDDSYAIEAGLEYMRFYMDDGE